MGSIKPLPEAVRSSVRSGIILYDLTRVVEELVFNSLDAGATKVHVAVGVGTSFIKVLDNGSGIGRDGLALLGERYATSSYESFVGLDSGGTFGFRGEALCSIADVSLLEVTTKTHGMPHGYRKIMKGRKCLYIGIDDDRRDVGTTVIVRDLFYNQPVRRKHMLSSPKKVLHSIKKCMLRIALVQSRVSLRVADIESDDELLSTSASPSPLQLLSSNFGIEASSSLNELKASEGGLKLSGYISSPFGILSLKVFQYIYINSRFVCKGPIHKMLNQLAVGSWGNGKYNNESQYEKRSRLQTCPSFILNLSCPRSLYDITFEPSKNLVEFREWGPILTFVQNAVTRIWAESFSDDLPVNCEVGKKRCRTQKWQASLDDCKTLPAWRKSQSCEKSNAEASELEKYHMESLHVRDTDNAVALDSSSCGLEKYTESNPDMQFYDNFLSMEENFSSNNYAADKSNKQVDYFLGLRWQNESFKEDDSPRYMSMGSAVSTDCHRITNHADVNQEFSKVHQLNCLRRGSLLHHGPSFRSELEIPFARDDFPMQKEWVDNDEDIGIGEEDEVNHLLKDTYSQQAEVKPVWSFSKCTNSHKARLNPNFSLRYMKSPLIAGECSGEEKDLLHYSRKDVNHCSLDLHSSTTDWTPLASGCLFDTTIADIDNLIGENNLETQFECRKGTKYTHFPDGEEDCNFSLDMAVDSWDQNCSISRYADFTLNQELNAGSWRERGKFSRRKFEGSFSPSCSKIFADEEDCGHLHISCQDKLLDSSDQPNHPPVSAQSNRMKYRGIQVGNQDNVRPHKKMSRRGHSAPPFHKHRKKFLVLNDSLKMATTINNDFLLPETRSLNHPKHCSETSKMNYRKQLFNSPRSSSMSNYVDDSFSVAVLDMKRTPEPLQVQNRELKEQGKFIHDSVKGFAPKEVEDILDSRQKWHNHCPETERGVRLHNVENQDAILDISSGILHLAGDSLVPSSIDKNSLKVARVLQQVDKKFIPIIAGRTLAIIDQHAADERIRLEELRQKVLSGKMKQITHLEAEQELVLPEIGYQLLHNYSEQIQNWGWICNFSTQGSRPFTKSLNVLHRQPTIAKLLAVPCILGVILTDLDLLEFLQQLADTDGSSTIPPSVHRVLNNKACRGAIMFGDTLLPSECSLIVEELKQTSLCFQCAHGRPTTVPLVNLDALHKHINELGLCSSGTNGSWHGLRRHEISLNRAASRLSSAID